MKISFLKIKDFLQLHKIAILMLLSCLGFYWSFAYDLDRADFVKLFGLYGALFFLSWKFYQMNRNNLKLLAWTALLFRLIFLFSLPNLSQDFHRFLWDGHLLIKGLNPYISTPNELISQNPFPGAAELFEGMGSLSAGNHTNYPPLNQIIFALAALVGGKSVLGGVLFLRSIIIAADVGIFFFGRKLLRRLNLSENRIFWYLLNPFIIIELTGNLHFEGVMIFFLLVAILFLQKNKWVLSSIFFSLSVLTKLIPLIVLPLVIKNLGVKKGILYSIFVGVLVLLFFLPFSSVVFAENYAQSVGLWFQKFEFNASIYYLIRWIGYEVVNYNIIQSAGPILGLITFFGVLALAFFRRNITTKSLVTSMMFAIAIYLFLSTTVHPWYLATPLFLSIFTRYRFMIVWSFVIVLSYFTYSNPEFQENLWLVALEYLFVMGTMAYELWKKKSASAGEDAEINSA